MILPSGTLLQGGKYRIEEKIGQGGFGITYRACQPLMLDRKVCIKEFYLKQCFSRESTSSAITYPNDSARKDAEIYQQKFIKEAQTLYSMHHPNIMEIYDIFEENNTAYYVMEYIEGESLKDMLVRRGSIPEAEAIGYIRKVAEALKYIHSRNFNHFDVKPDNILVRSSDKEVILIDFGTAKHYDSNTGNATTMTAGLLSRGYAPIEQYKEGGVNSFTPETDIYALGATLYKLLTGNTPPEPTEIISNGIPELPSSVSKATKDLIKWAMQLNKTDRPHSCDEFMKALPSNVEGSVASHKNDADDATVSIDSEETTYIKKPSENNEETELVKQDKLPKPRKKRTRRKEQEEKEENKSYSDTQSSKTNKMWIWAVIGIVAIVGVMIGFFKNSENSNNNEIKTIAKDSTNQEIPLKKFTANGVSFEMIKVESGTFTMGATPEMKDPWDGEKPAHQVTLTDNYYLGKTEVTQALWKAIMGNNPSYIKGDNLPVENVNWDDCQQFISKLNSITKQNFRLPTEAEWEFAARGGNSSKHYQYSGSDKLEDVAWYADNSEEKSHDVATKQPNELGIYDMSGNVWEWCSDWYGNYSNSAQTNPTGASSGYGRVYRGGGWSYDANACRSSCRDECGPVYEDYCRGLRLALSE